jgi:hypothetical protein
MSLLWRRESIRLNCGKDTIIIWLASLCLSFSMLIVACLVYLSDPQHNVLEKGQVLSQQPTEQTPLLLSLSLKKILCFFKLCHFLLHL